MKLNASLIFGKSLESNLSIEEIKWLKEITDEYYFDEHDFVAYMMGTTKDYIGETDGQTNPKDKLLNKNLWEVT